MKVPSINSVVTNWRGEVVIRIVQSPPTHPQTLNNERSLNSTRYQSEKDILYSYTQLKLVSLSNNFKLKRWSVISCDSHNVLLSLHSALLGYCVWRGSHYSLWNDKKIEKEKERKRKKKDSLFWGWDYRKLTATGEWGHQNSTEYRILLWQTKLLWPTPRR